MLWSLIQIIGKQGIGFLTFLILSLILSPSEFGILGMAMAWIAFIQVFSEIGFGAALIQKKEVTPGHFSTAFFINTALGVLLTFIGIALSWPSAVFFKTPEVKIIMAVLSLNFVITSISLTHFTIAMRELKFKGLAARDIGASFAGGAAGIASALWGLGVWSLVIQSLVTSLIGSLLIWRISEWRPKAHEFSVESIKDLWPYGSRIFMFNMFKYLAQNVDRLFIGHFLGPVALGLYTFAFKIAVYPFSVLSGAIGNYMFPKFSREQERLAEISRSYVRILKKTNLITIPVLFAGIILSPVAVPILWNGKWDGAIVPIQILFILGFLQSLVSPTGQVMKALNRPGWLLIWSIFITCLTTLGILAGIGWDLNGVAIGITIAYAVALPVLYYYINKLAPLKIGSSGACP